MVDPELFQPAKDVTELMSSPCHDQMLLKNSINGTECEQSVDDQPQMESVELIHDTEFEQNVDYQFPAESVEPTGQQSSSILSLAFDYAVLECQDSDCNYFETEEMLCNEEYPMTVDDLETSRTHLSDADMAKFVDPMLLSTLGDESCYNGNGHGISTFVSREELLSELTGNDTMLLDLTECDPVVKAISRVRNKQPVLSSDMETDSTLNKRSDSSKKAHELFLLKQLNFLNHLSDEQLWQFECYQRSLFSSEAVKKVAEYFTGVSVGPNVCLALAAVAKEFVKEIVEGAVVVRNHWNELGPIQPKHIRESTRLLRMSNSNFPFPQQKKHLFD